MKLHIPLFLIFVAHSVFTSAQITVNKNSGCAPLTGIEFSSPTAGDWDFGNETSADDTSNVSATYGYPGIYTVTLTDDNGDTLDQVTITVFGNPTADFTTIGDTSGCAPFSASFNDASTAEGTSSIIDWNWAFVGTSTGSSEPNPSHTFTEKGKWDVLLIVEDENGCIDDTLKTDYITVIDPPIANFTASPLFSCTTPLNVTLNNTSTNSSGGTTNLIYEWDFDDSETSTSQNPGSHEYETIGNFTISLTVSENGGCSSVKTRKVNIGQPEAIIIAEDTVCIGSSALYSSNSNGGTTFEWIFDDGQTSTSESLNKTFNTSGNHEVTLIAIDAGCNDTTTKTIFVQQAEVTLTGSPSNQCEEPFCVEFTATGEEIIEWNYNFYGGQSSNEQNPQHCYSHIGGNEYTVYDYKGYNYTTTVTGTTVYGCSASANFRDTIFPLSSNFAPNTTQGCAPLEVTFQDSSASGSPIISYEYNFDDGATGSEDSVTHIFNTAGEYNVTLIIENENGCKDTSFPIQIQVGDSIDVDLSVSPSTVCIGDTVVITDATGDARIDEYHFSTDENRGSESCPDDSIQQWSYFHETGQHDVTFYANYNGCISEEIFTDAVTVNGPSSSFKWSGNCATPTEINFEATVSDVDSLYWFFGDNNTLATDDLADTTVTHSYSASGDYTVVLISTNNSTGCDNDTNTMLVKVRLLQAIIDVDSLNCSEVDFTASGENSIEVSGDCENAYRWDYGDSTQMVLSSSPTWTTSLSDTGSHTIRLMVYDVNGCRDTTEKAIVITDLYAGFKADTTTGCIPLTINFTDTSWSATKLETWDWTFDDGNLGTGPDTINQYTESNKLHYDVTLTVTDSLGCQDQETLRISPIIPDSNFTVNDQTICIGDSVTFTLNNENSMSNAVWDFGGPGISSELNPTFLFDTSGDFTINVLLIDTNGCNAERSINELIKVDEYPIAGYFSNKDNEDIICYPSIIEFTDTSQVNFGVTSFGARYWELDDVPKTSGLSVTLPFTEPGDYSLRLIEESLNGCRDSLSKPIKVSGPVGKIAPIPSIICVGDEITLDIIDSSDVFAFLWDFGDGIVTDTMYISNVTNADTSHRYNIVPPSGTTIAQLVIWSDGLKCRGYDPIDVNLHLIEADFGFKDSTVCLDVKAVFEDKSLSTSETTYSWDMGNGSTYDYVTNNVPEPEKYNTTGNYNIQLIINDPSSGCIDTTEKELIILPLPNVSTINKEICFGDPALLEASGVDTYLWIDTNSTVADVDSSSTLAYPDESINYKVFGTDTNGCIDSATANVAVLQEQPFIREDTCVIIGDSVTIGIDYGPGFTYDWSEGPTQFLECLTCPVQTIQITEEVDSILYELAYSDSLNCFPKVNEYNVCVEDKYTLDVPSAFTPDGSGENDIIYLKGHGIKELIYFRIYNRWGEIVFETTDINSGWNGSYKGTEQGIETFVYQAKVKFYNDEFKIKGGDITLIR
ncbi:MAG: hypothetical protein CMD18_03320 [Flavobacteriales bacterium]|nr:hypothetical protein [Flavobacteriales bacterium]